MTSIPNEPIARWAIIKTTKAGDDLLGPRDQVISVQRRRVKDGPAVIHRPIGKNAKIDSYSSEQVPSDVVPGMIRGGKFAAVGGFGWMTEDEMKANDRRRLRLVDGEWVEEPRSNRLGHPNRNRRREAA
jgi:hypothetical protein